MGDHELFCLGRSWRLPQFLARAETRVLVRTILGYLAHGETAATILADFPSLTEEDVRVIVAFAAASASEDLPAPTPAPHEVKVA